MKRLEVFLLSLDGMLVHRRSLPRNLLGFPRQFASTHLYTWVERGAVRVKCLAQEHNTMSPARAWTWTARSRVERTNHEATMPPTLDRYIGQHINRHLTDVLVDIIGHIDRYSTDMSNNISTDTGPKYWPRCAGRHIGWVLVDMSTDTRPICWSIWQPRKVQLLTDMSTDRPLTFCWYFTATCVLVTVACVADRI